MLARIYCSHAHTPPKAFSSLWLCATLLSICIQSGSPHSEPGFSVQSIARVVDDGNEGPRCMCGIPPGRQWGPGSASFPAPDPRKLLQLRGGRGGVKKRLKLPGGPRPKGGSSRMHVRSPRDKLYEYERDEMQQAAKRRRISRKNGEKKDPRSSWVSELVKEKQGLVDPKSLPQKRASQLKREGPSNAERRWAQEVFKDVPDKFKTKKQEPKQVERTGEQKAKSELVVKKGGVNMTAVIEGDIDEKKLTEEQALSVDDYLHNLSLRMTEEMERELHPNDMFRFNKTMPKEEKASRTLLRACENGDRAEAEEALQEGADVHCVDATNFYEDARGYYPMHWAADGGHVDLLELLVERGGNASCRTSDMRETPLHLAAANGHASLINRLLELGADVDARSLWRWTPLHCAARGGSVEAVEALLDAGADCNATGKPWKDPQLSFLKGLPATNPTPCQLALLTGDEDVLRVFHTRGLLPASIPPPPPLTVQLGSDSAEA